MNWMQYLSDFGVYVIGLVLLVPFIAFAVSIAKMILNAQIEFNSRDVIGDPMSHFGFAAIDMKQTSSAEVTKAVKRCADIAEEMLPSIKNAKFTLDSLGPRRIFTRDGLIKTFFPLEFNKVFSMKFCLGDSLSGLGILEKSVLLSLNIDGALLHQKFMEWRKSNALMDNRVIELGDYEINLDEQSLRLPSGITVRSGDILSLEMSENTKQKYLEEFEGRDQISKHLLKNEDDELSVVLSKLRIFGGFVINDDNGLELKCYRFPQGCSEPVEGSNHHPLDKINGFVVEHLTYAQISSLISEESKLAA